MIADKMMLYRDGRSQNCTPRPSAQALRGLPCGDVLAWSVFWPAAKSTRRLLTPFGRAQLPRLRLAPKRLAFLAAQENNCES